MFCTRKGIKRLNNVKFYTLSGFFLGNDEERQ